MKIFTTLFGSLTLGILCSQTVIPAVYNSSITADGVLNAGEWTNSSSSAIAIVNNTITWQVAFDSTNLYLLCFGKLESANALFPEVLLDVDNGKTSAWQNDDWWLHVSATDCENPGAYGVYNNCAAVQPDWEGVPNLNMGPPLTDTIEMAVRWSKLNFDPFSGKDIGISLLVTNTFNAWRLWPAGSNRLNPGSWGILDFAEVSTLELKNPTLNADMVVYPNPTSNGKFSVRTEPGFKENTIKISDATGNSIGEYKLSDVENGFFLEKSGIYFLQFYENGVLKTSRKLIISKE